MQSYYYSNIKSTALIMNVITGLLTALHVIIAQYGLLKGEAAAQ